MKRRVRNIINAVSRWNAAFRVWLSWQLGLRYWRAHYIRQTWIGEQKLGTATKVAILVHFSPKGRFLGYFQYLLKSLEQAGYAVIIVSNSPKIDTATLAAVLPHCAAVVRRRNVGYDFGAWRDGLTLIPDPDLLTHLLLVNDSVFGPLHDLGRIMERCDPTIADVWGITDNFNIRYHLQSYFLLFTRSAIRHPAFLKFFKRMRYMRSKTAVIVKYEIGLTQAMLNNGLRVKALYPYAQIADRIATQAIASRHVEKPTLADRYLGVMLDEINAGRPLNPSHYFWEYLISTLACPFLKRELLEKNPAKVPLLVLWRGVVQAKSDYPLELIDEYLQIASRDRVF